MSNFIHICQFKNFYIIKGLINKYNVVLVIILIFTCKSHLVAYNIFEVFMWSNVISLDKTYNREFDYLFEKIKNNKNLSYAYEESKDRNFLYLASVCDSASTVINEVENAICEVYLNHFKLAYFLSGFKSNISPAIVTLTSALLLFDQTYEDTLIRKVLSEVIDYNIDGILNFRLRDLTENWAELSELIANLISNSNNDEDIYSVAEFIHSQEGGKNMLVLGGDGLFNVTKSQEVKVENYFDNNDLNLLFAIIKESPKELVLNGAVLPIAVKKSLKSFAIINDAARYD